MYNKCIYLFILINFSYLILFFTLINQDELSPANKINDNNQNDNENGDSNHESSDAFDNIDNNTSSSTLSNNDQSTPTLARTPLLSKVSTYRTLPEMEKFGKDMGPLIMFENLSDSVGTYNKMKGLLSKVRTTLKSIHPYPSQQHRFVFIFVIYNDRTADKHMRHIYNIKMHR